MNYDNLLYKDRLRLAIKEANKYKNTALNAEEVEGLILDIADKYDVDDSDINSAVFGYE